MTKKQYKQLEAWANELGYFLGDNLEFKVKNGIGGIYATDDIPKNSIIYKGGTRTIFGDKISNKTRVGIEYLVRVVKEYYKGKDSKIYPMFDTFTKLDELKQTSVCFMSPFDLSKLQRLNVTAWTSTIVYRDKINRMVKQIQASLDSDKYSEDDILFIVLNSESRAWADGGFNPILDLFNHMNKKAMSRVFSRDGESFILGSKVNYKKGEQVYNSYGVSDVYRYAEHYRFFDGEDDTYIDISNRLNFPLNTDLDEKHFEEIKRFFDVEVIQNKTEKKYKILNPIFISEYGPSPELMKVVDILSRNTDDKFDNPKLVTHRDRVLTLFNWLVMLNNAINLDAVDVDSESDIIKMYYDMSVAELKVVEKCLDWIKKIDEGMNYLAVSEFVNNLENKK